jgi:hypothetical protein
VTHSHYSFCTCLHYNYSYQAVSYTKLVIEALLLNNNNRSSCLQLDHAEGVVLRVASVSETSMLIELE